MKIGRQRSRSCHERVLRQCFEKVTGKAEQGTHDAAARANGLRSNSGLSFQVPCNLDFLQNPLQKPCNVVT